MAERGSSQLEQFASLDPVNVHGALLAILVIVKLYLGAGSWGPEVSH